MICGMAWAPNACIELFLYVSIAMELAIFLRVNMYANYLYWENFLHFPFTEDGFIPLEIYQPKDPNLFSFQKPLQSARGEGQLYSHGRRWFYVRVTFYVVLSPNTHISSDPCSQLVYLYLLIIYDVHCYCVTLLLVLPNVPWHVKAVFL